MKALEASLDGGTLGVAAAFGEERFFFQEETVFPTASSIKVAIVEEVFRQGLDLAQPITVTEADFVGGSGVLAGLTPGLVLPLGDLATLTITVSDNTASNLCLRAVGGPDAVNARLAEWGSLSTRVHRPIKLQLVEGDPPHTATSTPADFLRMLPHLGPQTRALMAKVNDTAMFPRLLPFSTYAVAHKPGAVNGVRNEVGFIERDGQALSVVVLTKGCPDPRWTVENAGCLVVAHTVSQLVERFFGAG